MFEICYITFIVLDRFLPQQGLVFCLAQSDVKSKKWKELLLKTKNHFVNKLHCTVPINLDPFLSWETGHFSRKFDRMYIIKVFDFNVAKVCQPSVLTHILNVKTWTAGKKDTYYPHQNTLQCYGCKKSMLLKTVPEGAILPVN